MIYSPKYCQIFNYRIFSYIIVPLYVLKSFLKQLLSINQSSITPKLSRKKQALLYQADPSIENSNNFPRIRINLGSFLPSPSPPRSADLQGRLFPAPIVTQSRATYRPSRRELPIGRVSTDRNLRFSPSHPIPPSSPRVDLNEIHGIVEASINDRAQQRPTG